jgi:SAM-dependent methyltransferase
VRIESVWIGKDAPLLDAMLTFYAPTASRIIDVCCNERRMWKGSTWGPKVIGYDRDPAMNPDVVCEWHALPDAPGSVDVLVYDPPHMPTAASSPKSLAVYVDSYGLAGSVKADNIDSLHAPFLKEAARVLKDDGLVFAKIKDYIHNHRYQWNLSMFKEKVREAGLTACDLIIKRDPSGGNLKSGRWQRAHHAKNVHCFWVIVRKSHRCEPRMAA